MDRPGLFAALRDTTFRSLRHRNYRRYFFGQIVSFVGSWMQSAALMWLLYDRTGDPRWPSWFSSRVGLTVLLAPGAAPQTAIPRGCISLRAAFLARDRVTFLRALSSRHTSSCSVSCS